MKKEYKATFGDALFCLMFLIVTMSIAVLWLDIPIHIVILVSLFVSMCVVKYKGGNWDQIAGWLEYSGKIATPPILILMTIGTVIGSWMASGTVPMVIYWGLKLISPSIFLVTICIICGLVSLATGSSWSTGGTVGVALMGVGLGLGINPAMSAGAIISGCYFGDKMSPLSDTTNLAPAVSEGDLFDHIKSMTYTTIPALIITLVFYTILGMRYAGKALDIQRIENLQQTLSNTFNFNILVLIPVIVVIYLSYKKIPALFTLLVSAIVASIIAIIFQGETLTTITKIMDTGYTSQTGIAEIDKLLSRGGFQNMMWTSSLGIIGIALGAVLEKSGMLAVFLSKFRNLTRTTSGLVCTCVLGVVGLNYVTASQYMSIVLGGRMFVSAYK